MDGLLGGVGSIGEHAAGLLAGHQRAARQIASVGERLARGRQPDLPGRGEQLGPGQADQHQVVSMALHAACDRASEIQLARRPVVERAVRLDVREPAAARAHEAVQRGHLVEDEVLHLVERQVDLDAAKVLPVGVPGMRTDAHSARERQRDGAVHHPGAPGVHAAGDVRGSEEREQRLVVAPLAHVRVQIDAHRVLQAASASASEARSNRILCPGRACAKRGRSAPATQATRG